MRFFFNAVIVALASTSVMDLVSAVPVKGNGVSRAVSPSNIGGRIGKTNTNKQRRSTQPSSAGVPAVSASPTAATSQKGGKAPTPSSGPIKSSVTGSSWTGSSYSGTGSYDTCCSGSYTSYDTSACASYDCGTSETESYDTCCSGAYDPYGTSACASYDCGNYETYDTYDCYDCDTEISISITFSEYIDCDSFCTDYSCDGLTPEYFGYPSSCETFDCEFIEYCSSSFSIDISSTSY